jgi:hypothetical protein
VSHPVDILELALRLRRDSEEACMPEYADLMRRAAEELETHVRLADSAADHRPRRAG